MKRRLLRRRYDSRFAAYTADRQEQDLRSILIWLLRMAGKRPARIQRTMVACRCPRALDFCRCPTVLRRGQPLQ
jgi:hypothetical protein